MLKSLALAGALLCALTINAEARHARHRHHYAHHVIIADPGCNVIFPCEGVAPSPRGEMIARKVGFGTAQKIYTPHVIRPARAKPKAESRVSSLQSVVSSSIGKPTRYIAGRLICAVNVGAALAERGIKGTGSALALSYLHWGHSAGGPVPGAVIVSARRGGGHVAIVSRVENGQVYAWNATGGQSDWREIPYRLRVIDYRVP